MSEKIMLDTFIYEDKGKWIKRTVYVKQRSEHHKDDILIFEEEEIYAKK